ncbi:MAG: sigma 54-interacting transcriptional regulator [Alphaproteobacteria bacterium]|nr:sigma 54-interacting transcriptional regulator [Alphaproteobacteria bacterium]
MPRSLHLPLLLDLWREVGRHLEIAEFVDAVAPALAQHAGVRGVAVAAVDRERGVLRSLVGPAATAPLDPTSIARLVRAPRSLDALPLLDGPGWAAVLDDGAAVLLLALPDADGHALLLADLVEPFHAALRNHQRIHELARLREAVEADNRALLTRLQRQDIAETVVGGQSGLREVMQRVAQVAPTDAPVLILGETGSGKEVVARAIHQRSSRADGPFLRVNCGAIPAELVDSELFGHERGSFTGAVATRRGWFERADGGTLFLDELGELPAAAQVRLLRVLQDGTFERVGGQRVLRADVRIVAATHRDMHDLVAEGRFREDLWYRVAVFPVVLPPLRARRQDIPALADHFAERAGRRLHGFPLAVSPDDLALLHGYDWPGNVRELAAVIERAAILGDGQRLDLVRALGTQRTGGARPAAPVPVGVTTLRDAQRAAITAALQASRGQIDGPTGAAVLLDIHPSTLRSRMLRLGLDWRTFRPRPWGTSDDA